ncbi:MAG TPA: carboxymuconolactone decarboxylase family protein [Candidatus Dormibacteraeota bacterium]|jgi:AhpD family alkylhydroperoxidase|nr:carboxymuconolactone decarboxylase family protein [Candidatus Dormibacteraeota bacterium]
MEPRMSNPAMVLPEAMEGFQMLQAAVDGAGMPAKTMGLVHLRASQINGCSVCLEAGECSAQAMGEAPERVFSVANWRQASCFSDAERAALALTEAVTRLGDNPDGVPDEVWEEAARHYDEKGLAALILSIGITNVYNRLNVTTRQVAGTWS